MEGVMLCIKVGYRRTGITEAVTPPHWTGLGLALQGLDLGSVGTRLGSAEALGLVLGLGIVLESLLRLNREKVTSSVYPK